MGLMQLLFGAPGAARAKTPLVITHPPAGAQWRSVRPREDGEAVRARVAEADRVVRHRDGDLTAHGGEDMIVTHPDGEEAVVRRDIFDRTYTALGGGLYRKRDDIVLRYFTLDAPATIETLEGRREAAAGDWIMQGVSGELWPVPRDKAEAKYRPA